MSQAGTVLGRRSWAGAAAAVVVAMGVAGCGTPLTAGAAPPPPSTAASSTAGQAAFCEAVVDTDMSAASGPADIASATASEVPAAVDRYANALDALLPAMQASAPAPVSGDVAALVRLNDDVESRRDPAIYRSPDFLGAEGKVDAFVLQNCGYREIKVAASEYAYTGLPDGPVPAGTWAITVADPGKATHALLVARIGDAEQRPVKDLLALPADQAQQLMEPVGSVRVDPGQTATVFLRLPAGRYAVYCPVPTPPRPVPPTPSRAAAPKTPPPPPPPGPPHYAEGEFRELVVS